MKRLIVDAETDGLYGRFLTVALLVTDEEGVELDVFYGGVAPHIQQVETEWVKEHVLPLLGDYEVFDSQEALFEAVWFFWNRYRDEVRCFADVPCPVEARLFRTMVEQDLSVRNFQAPFPLLDLASMLYARGYNPLIDRRTLVGMEGVPLHNALLDARLTNAVLTVLGAN